MIHPVTSSAARPDHRPPVPAAEPAAIRACLPPAVAAEFDRNWGAVMDRAKAEQDLTLVHGFLARWRIMAYTEMTDPGSYFRLMELADKAMKDAEAGRLPAGGVSSAQMKAMIADRLAGR